MNVSPYFSQQNNESRAEPLEDSDGGSHTNAAKNNYHSIEKSEESKSASDSNFYGRQKITSEDESAQDPAAMEESEEEFEDLLMQSPGTYAKLAVNGEVEGCEDSLETEVANALLKIFTITAKQSLSHEVKTLFLPTLESVLEGASHKPTFPK